MSAPRSIAAAYEAQPIIEAMILLFEKEDLDGAVLSRNDARSMLERAYGFRPSLLAVSEAFDEGSRLGAWGLIGKFGDKNHIEVQRNIVALYGGVLRSQPDSTLYALEKVGVHHLRDAVNKARRDAEKDDKADPAYNSMMIALRRLQHNGVFQRGMVATKGDILAEMDAPKKRAPVSSIDWGKWGAIAGIAALPLAVLLWWLTK